MTSAFIGLLGAIVGALAVIAAGIVGQWWLTTLERRAAARLVFWEVVRNLSTMTIMKTPWEFNPADSSLLQSQAWEEHKMVFARLRDDSLLTWLESHYTYVAEYSRDAADLRMFMLVDAVDGPFRSVVLRGVTDHLRQLGELGKVSDERLKPLLRRDRWDEAGLNYCPEGTADGNEGIESV